MNKDVIYIDVEDDITTIVSKIKASKEKIIALVPPTRSGVLQSAVNMRILKRSADQASKRIVLISGNQSLASLAASAKIPVAKTLQSKPELVEVPALKFDDGDIIDGSTLPIGEIAAAVTVRTGGDRAVEEVIRTNAATPSTGTRSSRKSKSATKVPNFSSFRKKLVIFGSLGVLFVVFLVWAIWFAPRATVVITAKTTPVTIDDKVTLAVNGKTDIKSSTVRALRQEQQAEVAIEFTATGEKNVGDKAKGSIKLTRNSPSSVTIPAGTALRSSSGKGFLTDKAVTIPRSTSFTEDTTCFPTCPGTATVDVTASGAGSDFNGVTGPVTGETGGASGSFVGTTSGGTDRMASVVSDDDVKKATELLAEKKDDSLRSKLDSSFSESNVIIKESYLEKRSEPKPSVAIDEEAKGPVSLKATITASMLAVDRSDLSNYLKSSIEREIEGRKNQKIYKDGSKDVKFAQFSESDQSSTIRLTANGVIGPVIDESQVKEQARGKRYGEIQTSLEAIDGVEDVDTKFWPFWVRTVPNDLSRITVEFKLQNAS